MYNIIGTACEMNKKALKTLEYDKVIDRLSALATSDAGRDLCASLRPLDDREAVDGMQQETADALARLFRKGSISFGNAKDVRGSLLRLSVGASLSAAELLTAAGLLENAGLVKKYGSRERDDEEPDVLTPLFDTLEPLRGISEEIRRCILSPEEIADDATPALSGIRRRIRILRDRVQSELTRIIASRGSTYLQDTIITTRDGRYCVPVKQEHRADVPGIIHDQSSSGSTVFVEPAAVVSLNNDIRQEEIAEQKEIEAILATLSESLAAHSDTLLSDFEILRSLDFIFARARLAMDMNASRPVLGADGVIDLKKARHPLIPGNKVVPIDVRVGEDFDLLVITGPNTGGKTVTLKTTGLLVLMGLSGLHIPCRDRSRISVFREVYADIGDEQSIEQSLSTFSSHMTNIVSFLKRADRNSLVLFDELGAGTDPTEGAALAISILSALHEKHIRTIATTHYSELKIYALRTDGVENASCEFDVATLSPTYRLLIGIPGKSNAFAISRKLGLPEEIISRAQEQLGEADASFEDVISQLDRSRRAMEAEREELSRRSDEIDALKKELTKKKQELSQKKTDQIRSASEEARNILQNAKDYADKTIRDFSRAAEKGASIRELEEKREKLRHKIDNYGKAAAEKKGKAKKGTLTPADLHVGDRVHILSLDVDAIVNTLPGRDGMLFIVSGILRTKVHYSDLEFIEPREDAKAAPASTGSGAIRAGKAAGISSELNLIGQTVDEAIPELDKFLDDAAIAHLKEVRIVHGKGTGALRTGVHQYLKKQKRVSAFRLGEYGEGDAGVTIATLR